MAAGSICMWQAENPRTQYGRCSKAGSYKVWHVIAVE